MAQCRKQGCGGTLKKNKTYETSSGPSHLYSCNKCERRYVTWDNDVRNFEKIIARRERGEDLSDEDKKILSTFR